MLLGQELKYLNDLQLPSWTRADKCQSLREYKLIYKKTHPGSDAISVTSNRQQDKSKEGFLHSEKKNNLKKKSNHDVKWSFPEEIEETDGASGDFLDQRKAQHASIACIAGQTLLLFSW